MKVNLHTHTVLCGHAQDSAEDYVLNAIENGIEVMGFSEHAPFRFPDGYESGHRVPMSKAEQYVNTVNYLREKYKDKIKIYLGYELEYFPLYFKDMYKTLINFGAEYLILGQHHIKNEHPNGYYIGMIERSVSDLSEYVNCAIEGMQTGVFTYMAHPDVIQVTSDDEVYAREMTRLCKAAKETNTPLEINFLGIRDNRFYPHDKFWEIAGEVGCSVVFGLDAHTAESAAFDEQSLKKAKQMVKDFNLNLIERPKIINLKNL